MKPLDVVRNWPLFSRNRTAFADHLRRTATRHESGELPDPRSQEQQDLGAELSWRQAVARKAITK